MKNQEVYVQHLKEENQKYVVKIEDITLNYNKLKIEQEKQQNKNTTEKENKLPTKVPVEIAQ